MGGYGAYTNCSVPTSMGQKTFENDFGVQLDEIQDYCKKSK